jgi:hypothetical protein
MSTTLLKQFIRQLRHFLLLPGGWLPFLHGRDGDMINCNAINQVDMTIAPQDSRVIITSQRSIFNHLARHPS